MCDLGVRKFVEHVVLECRRYEEEKTSFRESFESRARVRVEEMDREEQMCLIAGGPGRKEGDGSGEEFLGEDVKGEV